MIRSRVPSAACLGLTLMILAGPIAPARAADVSASEGVLKENGFHLVGHSYSHESEEPVLKKMKEFRKAYADWKTAAAKIETAENDLMTYNQLNEAQAELNQGIGALSMQASSLQAPRQGRMMIRSEQSQLNAQKTQLQQNLNTVKAQMNALKAKIPTEGLRREIESDIKTKRDAFVALIPDLRSEVDGVTARYAALAKTAPVHTAIEDLKKNKLAKLKLGPSDEFIAGARQLGVAERDYTRKPTTKHKTKAKTTSAKPRDNPGTPG